MSSSVFPNSLPQPTSGLSCFSENWVKASLFGSIPRYLLVSENPQVPAGSVGVGMPEAFEFDATHRNRFALGQVSKDFIGEPLAPSLFQ
jgi:hypothetical protein